MYRHDTTYDSGRNLMHQTNDEICIGENAKATQYDPEFENANNEEHLEAPNFPILAVNAVKNNARIFRTKCTRRSYSLSVSLFSFPIRQQLSKTTNNLQ